MGGTLLGTAAALGATIKAAGDLESRYASMARVTGMSSDNLAKLRGNLEAIARATPGASHESMIGVANFAARLGVGGNSPRDQIAGLTELAQSLSKLSLVMDDMPIEDAATRAVYPCVAHSPACLYQPMTSRIVTPSSASPRAA